MKSHSTILVLDFGSQYTQLIARRIREHNVRSVIYPFNISQRKLRELNPDGIILSGGPTSVYDKDSPKIHYDIFDLKIPILGICYGMQLIAQKFNGKVEPAQNREYGKSKLEVLKNQKIFDDITDKSIVWMSHGDYITEIPENFDILARSENSPICALGNVSLNIYGLQFHPEVAHTEFGHKIMENFLFKICNCKPDWTPSNFVDEVTNDIKEEVKELKVVCALSGGVDSSVAAVLLHRAIGDNLICVHVDNGLMRKNESEKVVEMFRKNFNIKIIHSDSSEIFLERLSKIIDPERKRKIIGNMFIEIFEKEAKKFGNAEYLVQGTLYPDVIESASHGTSAHTIKTHHNVGGLPEKMNLKLIEPFKELFKDEVREIGELLGLPHEFVHRHPLEDKT